MNSHRRIADLHCAEARQAELLRHQVRENLLHYRENVRQIGQLVDAITARWQDHVTHNAEASSAAVAEVYRAAQRRSAGRPATP